MPDRDDATAIQDASDHPNPTPRPPLFDGPLSRAVRAFIGRVGAEVALEHFLSVPNTGPRPLSLERVRRVAAGEAEPTLRMAEVVFDDYLHQAAHVPTRPARAPEPFTPAAVQPWATPAVVAPARVRQPWE